MTAIISSGGEPKRRRLWRKTKMSEPPPSPVGLLRSASSPATLGRNQMAASPSIFLRRSKPDPFSTRPASSPKASSPTGHQALLQPLPAATPNRGQASDWDPPPISPGSLLRRRRTDTSVPVNSSPSRLNVTPEPANAPAQPQGRLSIPSPVDCKTLVPRTSKVPLRQGKRLTLQGLEAELDRSRHRVSFSPRRKRSRKSMIKGAAPWGAGGASAEGRKSQLDRLQQILKEAAASSSAPSGSTRGGTSSELSKDRPKSRGTLSKSLSASAKAATERRVTISPSASAKAAMKRRVTISPSASAKAAMKRRGTTSPSASAKAATKRRRTLSSSSSAKASASDRRGKKRK